MSAPPSLAQAPLSISTKVFYGVGSVAYGVKDNGFAFLLLLFYNQVLHLPAQWVGAGIMLALIVDAITDPIVGYVSDNLHSRWGRRHPFMYAAAIPVACSYYVLWNPPAGLTPGQLFAYFLVMAVLVRIFITFYEIPSTALVSELTEDYDQRTALLGFRYFFGWWGGLAMAVLAFLVFLPRYGGVLEAGGYSDYSLTAAIVMVIAIFTSAAGTHRHIPSLKKPPAREPFALRRTAGELRETLANRSFLVLFVSALFTAMAAGVSTSLSIYFNTFFWEFDSTQIGYLNVPFFVSAAVALFVAPQLSIRFGKKYAAIGVAGVAFLGAPVPILLRLLGWFPANGTDTLFYTMLGFGAFEVTLIIVASILISAMVADVVEDSELVTGRRSEGVFFAARSFAQKAVHGIGTFSATMILTVVSFPTDAQPGDVAPEIIRNLGVVYVPVLMVLYVMALVLLTGYRISRETHAENLRRLSEEPASP